MRCSEEHVRKQKNDSVCVRVKGRFFACLLLSLLSTTVSGCFEYHYYPVHVDVDYYIVNAREDDIMVKDKQGGRGIVAFFLAPGEAYHFGYHKDVDVFSQQESIEQDDLDGLRLIFYFYTAGPDGRFDEYIGVHEFIPYLDENNCFVDTFFVR